MKQENPSDSDTIMQFRISDTKRARIIRDPNPLDPHEDFSDPTDKVIQLWKDGEVYKIIYESCDNCNSENPDWTKTGSLSGNYGLNEAVEALAQNPSLS